jgi:hypothetical protein
MIIGDMNRGPVTDGAGLSARYELKLAAWSIHDTLRRPLQALAKIG